MNLRGADTGQGARKLLRELVQPAPEVFQMHLARPLLASDFQQLLQDFRHQFGRYRFGLGIDEVTDGLDYARPASQQVMAETVFMGGKLQSNLDGAEGCLRLEVSSVIATTQLDHTALALVQLPGDRRRRPFRLPEVGKGLRRSHPVSVITDLVIRVARLLADAVDQNRHAAPCNGHRELLATSFLLHGKEEQRKISDPKIICRVGRKLAELDSHSPT